MRDTDWEVDFDPTIVQLTDGLSCLDKRALRQSWAEKDGVWPRISLSPMHVQSCNAVEADDVSWGHMSVVVRARLLSPRMQLKCFIACWYQKTQKCRSQCGGRAKRAVTAYTE